MVDHISPKNHITDILRFLSRNYSTVLAAKLITLGIENKHLEHDNFLFAFIIYLCKEYGGSNMANMTPDRKFNLRGGNFKLQRNQSNVIVCFDRLERVKHSYKILLHNSLGW